MLWPSHVLLDYPAVTHHKIDRKKNFAFLC